MNTIYLDHNSTTPILPEVAEAIQRCLAAGYVNPASQHSLGRAARRLLEEAREAIAQMLHANLAGHQADQLIFTSGGTESNHLALLGIAKAAVNQTNELPPEAIISAIEHPSVMGASEILASQGWKIHRLPVDANGVIQLPDFDGLLNPQTRLVSVMLANNETGVLQPVAELAAKCRAAKVPLHTDATQVVGKMPVDFSRLGVDALTFAAHKFHGPVGIGGLLLKYGLKIEPLWRGGFQQASIRPGTENVALAVGMQTALAEFSKTMEERQSHLLGIRNQLEAGLQSGCLNVVINGVAAPRLPNTSNVAFIGCDRQQLLVSLDLAGIACSTGSACASGSSEPSPVLKAMNLPPDVIASSLRFSVGVTTTIEDVATGVERIAKVVAEHSLPMNPKRTR